MVNEDKRHLAIFWDYENLPTPAGMSGFDFVAKIRQETDKIAPIRTFRAYSELKDTSRNAVKLRSELQLSGVAIVNCPHNGFKEVVDKALIAEIALYCADHPSAIVAVISGDRDYAHILGALRLRQCKTVVIAPEVRLHPSMMANAWKIIDWYTLFPSVGKKAAPAVSVAPPLLSEQTVFVDHLAKEVDDSMITELFKAEGFTTVSCQVLRKRCRACKTLKEFGYALVDVANHQEQQRAISLLDGRLVEGTYISVKAASSESGGKKNSKSRTRNPSPAPAPDPRSPIIRRSSPIVMHDPEMTSDAEILSMIMSETEAESDDALAQPNFGPLIETLRNYARENIYMPTRPRVINVLEIQDSNALQKLGAKSWSDYFAAAEDAAIIDTGTLTFGGVTEDWVELNDSIGLDSHLPPQPPAQAAAGTSAARASLPFPRHFLSLARILEIMRRAGDERPKRMDVLKALNETYPGWLNESGYKNWKQFCKKAQTHQVAELYDKPKLGISLCKQLHAHPCLQE